MYFKKNKMSNLILPTLSQKQIDESKNDTWDFLFLFLDHYLEELYTDESEEVMSRFSEDQHTLIAYNFLYNQLTNGDFLQLILNGFAPYIFDNPFSENLRKWDLYQTAELVDQAKLVYEKHKNDFLVERTPEQLEQFMTEMKDFEPFDNQFFEIKEEETEKVKHYVEEYINRFAIVE